MGAGDRFLEWCGSEWKQGQGDGSIELKLREGALSCLSVCPKSGT